MFVLRSGIRYRRALAAFAVLALPLALAACGGGDHENDKPAAASSGRNSAYLAAQAGDVIGVRIEELNPTQGAIGYDQIYYKLGRWQGDFSRPTWPRNSMPYLDYLNRTIGKKFDDYCEDTGRSARAQPFASVQEAERARLDDPSTFTCLDEPGAHPEALKTVVVGWDGNLYLTDGHHSFSALREIADGGPKLKVWVKVDANYSHIPTREAFWQRLVDERKAWLRDGDNQPITVDQLPKRLGLAHAEEPGGMQDDPYRSLVYFTRDVAYSNGGLPEFAEFLWGDWLRRQTANGSLAPLSNYKTGPSAPLASVLAESTLKKDLSVAGSNDSYAALVRDAALRMNTLAGGDAVFGDTTARQLGHFTLLAGQEAGTPTKAARDALEELPRMDVKSDGSPRTGGKLRYSASYRHCGKPAPGTCWGW
ncbi:ParB/Srx family N-terminal domain-containing protein [Bordetella avium]|uniref:ParB/Srx family N-terminal domain-containing protein n=1 Tax=Bordetella avium TaxID=521 RepID=UPI0039FD891F